MVCFVCGTRQPNAPECALCGEADELRSYSSERGRDPDASTSRGAKCVGGLTNAMKGRHSDEQFNRRHEEEYDRHYQAID